MISKSNIKVGITVRTIGKWESRWGNLKRWYLKTFWGEGIYMCGRQGVFTVEDNKEYCCDPEGLASAICGCECGCCSFPNNMEKDDIEEDA